MNEKKALGSRDCRGALLFAVCVCCWMLCAARAAEGRGCGVAIAASAARNLSHYLFLWISRAPAPEILRARPPASSELQRRARIVYAEECAAVCCWLTLLHLSVSRSKSVRSVEHRASVRSWAPQTT